MMMTVIRKRKQDSCYTIVNRLITCGAICLEASVDSFHLPHAKSDRGMLYYDDDDDNGADHDDRFFLPLIQNRIMKCCVFFKIPFFNNTREKRVNCDIFAKPILQ